MQQSNDESAKTAAGLGTRLLSRRKVVWVFVVSGCAFTACAGLVGAVADARTATGSQSDGIGVTLIWAEHPCSTVIELVVSDGTLFQQPSGELPPEHIQSVARAMQDRLGENQGTIVTVSTGWPARAFEGSIRMHEVTNSLQVIESHVDQFSGVLPLTSRRVHFVPMETLRVVPFAPILIGCIVDVVFWGTASLGILSAYLGVRRALRNRRGVCPVCGYSLVGLLASTCPECGRRHSIKK